MNEYNDPIPDEVLEEFLAPWREMECPAEVRRANRRAVESAFARGVRAPWWRRTVAVPLPLAVAASLLLVFTFGALLLPAASKRSVTRTPVQPLSVAAVTSEESPGWRVSRSYILSIDSLPRIEKSFPRIKENRNDS